MTLLCALVSLLPLGTNLGLRHLVWMLTRGRRRASRGAVFSGLSEGSVTLSLLSGDSGPKVGYDRRIRDRIRPVPALATARIGPAWGGFVQ